MPKTPEEIKKALECCFNVTEQCGECPYYPVSCDKELVRDARVYIRQLEMERDALKDEVDRDCETCKHNDACQEDGYCMWCDNKESNKTACCNCVYSSNWEWRGVQKED